MSADLELRCRCGAVRGVLRDVSAGTGQRLLCYCDDCQAFAHFLAHPEHTLDARGGTDIYQVSPAHVELRAGAEALACVRLRPGGLLRWYAACCRTPLGNTPASARLPFVGLIHTSIGGALDGRPRDEVLGPVQARVFESFATDAPTPRVGRDRPPLRAALRMGWILLRGRLRGDQRRSPFFDSGGRPRVEPAVLTRDQRRELRERVAAQGSA